MAVVEADKAGKRASCASNSPKAVGREGKGPASALGLAASNDGRDRVGKGVQGRYWPE